MKDGLRYKPYRTMRARLRLAQHILSSASGVAEGHYPERTLRRLETMQNKMAVFLEVLDWTQQHARAPKVRANDCRGHREWPWPTPWEGRDGNEREEL